MRRNTILLPVLVVALTAPPACDTRAVAADARGPHTRSFIVETHTDCRAGAARSVEKGRSTITLARGAIMLGAEDEALAGIPLPCSIRDDRLSVAPMRLKTGEPFGEIHVVELSGTLGARSMTLTYTFSAIDVTCTVTGSGREIKPINPP